MILTETDIARYVAGFMWPFMRIGSVLIAAPIFGTRLVPLRIRIGFSLLLTLLIFPLLPSFEPVDVLSLKGLFISIQQIVLGLSLGFVLQLTFNALVLAGELMAMSMGLGFASMIDPQNGVNVPVIAQFFVIIATLLFLALNGHVILIGILVDSFKHIPVNAGGLSLDAYWLLIEWSGFLFLSALHIAMPVVMALMITYLALGVMTRAAPQLNIFSIGFPITILVGFIAMLLTMPSFLPSFNAMLDEAFTALRELLEA